MNERNSFIPTYDKSKKHTIAIHKIIFRTERVPLEYVHFKLFEVSFTYNITRYNLPTVQNTKWYVKRMLLYFMTPISNLKINMPLHFMK